MHRALAALLLLLLALIPRAAFAQQTLTEYVWNQGHILVFCEDDVRALDAAATLTDEQKEAARILLKSAAQRIQRTQTEAQAEHAKKFDWNAVYALPADEQAPAQEKLMAEWTKAALAISEQCAHMEREALRDLHSLLTPTQVEQGWPRFERQRRRLLISVGFAWDLGSDPRDLVAAAKLDEADLALAQPILQSQDEAIDPLILRRMSHLAEIRRQMSKSGKADDPDAYNHPALMAREIRQLNVRTFRELERSLSESGRKRLQCQRVGTELQYAVQRPSTDYRIAGVLVIETLTADQRARMKSLIAGADAEVLDQAVSSLRIADDATMRSEPESAEAAQRRQTAATAKANETIAALQKELRSLLTAAQIEELDGHENSRNFTRAFETPRRTMHTSPWIDPDPQPAANPLAPPPQATTP